QVRDEDADYQKALEESIKDAYALPKGPLSPMVIREPKSRKYQPLPEVPGKGKAKVTKEQSVNKEESEKVVLGAEEGGQDEGQAGSNPNAQAKYQTGSDTGAQARPDPADAKAKVQSISIHVVHAGSDREHMDLDVADVSPQPSTEQLDEWFTVTVYPNVQENLKLAIEEPVLLEEPASSSGTLSSLQHLSRDFSFGDQFFSDKHSDADKYAKTEVESMTRVSKEHQQLKATTTDTTTTTITTTLPPPQAPQQSTTEAMMVSIAVSEVVTDAVDWAMQAPLRNRFRDLPEADMKEILHQRMWESDSYKSHEDHMQLFEALEKSMNRDHSKELAQDLDEARKKKKKSRESPKTPPGSPSHQPPPPPPPAGPSPPPSSTNQESPSKGSAAPSPSKTAASAEYQAWMTTDIRLMLSISLTPADLEIDEDMAPDEQEQSSDDEDIESSHIPMVNLRQGWQTGDIATFIDWFCKRRGITKLKPQDLKGPAYEIVKVFHPDSKWCQISFGLNSSANTILLQCMVSLTGGSKDNDSTLIDTRLKRVEDFQLGIESYQTQVNLTKPQWTAMGFEYKHDYTVIESSRAVIFQDKYGVQMMMRFNEIHKFSDGTLLQIDKALDYRVKEFRINSEDGNPARANIKQALGFNLLVHSLRALSALRHSGLRTASTAAKPCQRDSLEFYLITGSIHTDQRGTVGNPQQELQEKGVINSGCSRHMTGNMFYLSEYEEIDGRYVAFEGDPKRGKITCKGIKREFSVAMTPQQNSVAERKNKTLIEVARTMLADSKLPTTFWAEAVNTTCYVQNRAGEGFLIGYSTHSKAFRVFNTIAKIVEENLHINFLENKPNVAGIRPNWMSDIDSLTLFMNYQPVFAGNQTNGPKSSDDKVADDAGKKSTEVLRKENEVQDPAKQGDKNDQQKDVRDQEEAPRNQSKQESKRLCGQGEAANTNITNKLKTVSSPVNVVSSSFTTVDPGRERAQRNEFKSVFGHDKDATDNKMFTPISDVGSTYVYLGGSIPVNVATLPNVDLPIDPLMPDLEDIANTGIFSGAYDDEVEGVGADFNNLELTTVVSPIPTTRIHKDHPKEQIIRDPLSALQTRRMTKSSQEHAMSTFLYGTIEKEVYVCQPPSFEDPHFSNKVYKVEKALYGLHQALRAWDSPFDLEAFLDSDYDGASLDRKSTTGGCQFLGKRLILRQCKKQTVVVNSTTEAEYIAAASCYIQKKQKSRRIQRKETEVPHTEPQTEESVPTTSNNPLPSGKDRMKLTELINLCTNLQKQVLNLEKAKTTQAKEIADLKSRVKRLEEEKEDASKQERMINNIDQDEEIALVNETQGRLNEEEMFGVDDLDGDEVIMDVTTGENVEQSTKDAEKEVSTTDPVTTAGEVVTIVEVTIAAATPQISKDELTLAKTLIEIKESKPKTKGAIIQDPSEFRTTSSSQPLQLPQIKDKGKLKAEMKAKIEEEERIAREKDEANMVVIKQWDEVQAKTDAEMEVNTFVDMNTEIVEERSKKTQVEVTKGNSKRAGDEIEQEGAKRQNLEKENDTTELRRCLEIVPENDFLTTSESSNDDSNVVNAPQEPIVFSQNPRKDSSQSPPLINHQCCYGCGDLFDGVFCRRCTCESCGNGAHIGYNCQPKFPIVSNPKPCHNQNIDELSQTLTNFHPTRYSGDEDPSAHDFTPNFVNDSPNNRITIKTLISFKIFKLSNKNVFVVKVVGARMKISNVNKRSSMNLVMEITEDVQELFRKLLNDVKNIHEELAKYINIPSWNSLVFSSHDDDDDENYTIAITPEEPDNSLSMEDEHLDTISTTKSDKVIKSSIKDLVPIPSEFEGIPDNTCDVPFLDDSPPLDVSKDQFEEFSGSNDDSTSIDNNYFSIYNINYVEASPLQSELVSLDEVKDDNLREKLLNVNLHITKIKSLNDNPTPDHMLKSPSLFPILAEDNDSFLEKSETNSGSTTTHVDYSLSKYDSFLFEIKPDQGEFTSVVILAEPRDHVPNVLTTHPILILDSDFITSDNSLLESKIFYFNVKEKNRGSTTIYADISLPDLERFNFNKEPDLGELTSLVGSRIRENVLSATNVNLPPKDDHFPLFAYVVWIFLAFLTYSMVPPNLLSFRNADTIFDPGISNYHFSSFMPGVSHRSGTFMKFNVYPNHLNESPMEILSSIPKGH
nr:ribonuclease H-like domain-containing protein [Tanacetum cinerariifolium]